jgi:hypothetical protein
MDPWKVLSNFTFGAAAAGAGILAGAALPT